MLLPAVPEDLRDSARIFWMMSEWCNYKCEFCGVQTFLKRSPNSKPQRHAFDHYSAQEWVSAFRSFPQKKVAIEISGGEPFLDHKNFPVLLRGLLDDGRYVIRVNSNIVFDPAPYRGMDCSRIHLVATFHPCETSLADYRRRLHRLRDAGFSFCYVGIILSPENLDFVEEAIAAFDDDGFPTVAWPMVPVGKYEGRKDRPPREREMIRRHALPIASYFALLRPETKGRACYYPSLSYYMWYDGGIKVFCVGSKQNIFTDGIPDLPRQAVACPFDHCEGCAQQVRSIVGLEQYGKPVTLFDANEFRQELVEYKASVKSGTLDPINTVVLRDVDRYLDTAHYEPPPADFVSLESLAPSGPPFGYIDKQNDEAVVTARSRDRIRLSGWAVSSRIGEAIREVRIVAADLQVAAIQNFYPRPEVVEYLSRQDVLMSGWHGMFYLPILKTGDYRIAAHPVTASGRTDELPPFTLRIID
jgi:hypothetical protein